MDLLNYFLTIPINVGVTPKIKAMLVVLTKLCEDNYPRPILNNIENSLSEIWIDKKGEFISEKDSSIVESLVHYSTRAGMYVRTAIYLSSVNNFRIIAVIAEDRNVCFNVKKTLEFSGYEVLLSVDNFLSGWFFVSEKMFNIDEEKEGFSDYAGIDFPDIGIRYFYALGRPYHYPGKEGFNVSLLQPVFKYFGDGKGYNADGTIGIYTDESMMRFKRSLDNRVACNKRGYHQADKKGNLCTDCEKTFSIGQEVNYRDFAGDEIISIIYGEDQITFSDNYFERVHGFSNQGIGNEVLDISRKKSMELSTAEQAEELPVEEWGASFNPYDEFITDDENCHTLLEERDLLEDEPVPEFIDEDIRPENPFEKRRHSYWDDNDTPI